MGLLTDVIESFRPDFSPSGKPLRVLTISMGLVCLIGTLAGKIFGTMSTAQMCILGGFGTSLVISGAIGSLGLLALTAIVALGIQTAFAPPISNVVVLTG